MLLSVTNMCPTNVGWRWSTSGGLLRSARLQKTTRRRSPPLTTLQLSTCSCRTMPTCAASCDASCSPDQDHSRTDESEPPLACSASP